MLKKMVLVAAFLPIFFLAAMNVAGAVDKTADQIVKEARAMVKEVSIDDVRNAIEHHEKGIIILDVRDKNELEDGRLPGAMNISRGMLEFKAAAMLPDKTARIFVYCGLDLRSPLATRTLNEMGYVNAVNMAGGFKAWKAAEYPVLK